MESGEPGLDSELRQQAGRLCEPGLRLARVTTVDRGSSRMVFRIRVRTIA